MSKANFRATEAEGFGAIISKTATATLTERELLAGIIIADTTGGAIALTLPSITAKIENMPIYIGNKTGTNAVTVVAPSGDLYYGGGNSTSFDTVTLTESGAMGIIIAVDGNWYALAAAVIA